MKVLLDTNVIIAAFAARGLSADVLELCLSGHTVITSEYILSEVREKLTGKIALPASIADDIIAYLREYSILAVPLPVTDVECRDEDDLPVLGAAVAGHADYLITGDKDLLVLERYRNILIITPRQFWELLRAGRGQE
jgi:putative PIN family toxin of toxin-antitoxin system